MRSRTTGLETLILFFIALGVVPLFSQPSNVEQERGLNTIGQAEAEAIGTDIYIYGYPLVIMDQTKKVMTNTVTPNPSQAPLGQFVHARTYPDVSSHETAAPNIDTLYSTAWLDVSKEPYILHVPNENGRHYLMPMLSGWTDVFAAPGTRTTGSKAGDYAITGPGWQGTLPDGMIEFKSPTNIVWILGRTYSSGTPEDLKKVHAIQDQYSLTPLSAYGKPYTPPNGLFDSNIEMKTSVSDQISQLDAASFFNRLALLMKDNPPAPEDGPILDKMKQIGLIPGQPFDINKRDPAVVRGLQRAPKTAAKKIRDHIKIAGIIDNGWVIPIRTGRYGTDYLQRAFIATIGLGAAPPQDAIFANTGVDADGELLDGANRYVLHLPDGKAPPVKGFWSLTVYGNDYFLVNNPLNRYALNSLSPLKYNPDGSLDLYLQRESPGSDKESNWLPVPKENFNLMLRLYWPGEAVINGTWKPPAVKRL
jgi:DNA sulfur modification protein DndE